MCLKNHSHRVFSFSEIYRFIFLAFHRTRSRHRKWRSQGFGGMPPTSILGRNTGNGFLPKIRNLTEDCIACGYQCNSFIKFSYSLFDIQSFCSFYDNMIFFRYFVFRHSFMNSAGSCRFCCFIVPTLVIKHIQSILYLL